MRSSFIINNIIPATEKINILPSPQLDLAELKFTPVNVDGIHLSQYQHITYRGKPLALFGPAPDKLRRMTPALLKNMFKRYNIKRIHCIDQRRNQCLDPALDSKIPLTLDANFKLTWFNIHRYEKTLGIKFFNAYNGMRFDLADVFDINFGGYSEKDQLQIRFMLAGIKPTKLANINQQSINNIEPLKAKLYSSYTSTQYYGDYTSATAKGLINQLRFYPSPPEIHAFTNSMNEAYKLDEQPLVYCAGGVGRTSLFLAFWLQHISQCTLSKAVSHVIAHYLMDEGGEIMSLLYHMKFEMPTSHKEKLTHYCTMTAGPSSNYIPNTPEKIIAQKLLSQPYINCRIILDSINQLKQLKLTTHHNYEELFTILQSLAEETGMTF